MKKDIFVSYSSKDIAIAQAIVNCFESKGLNCWVQYRDSKGVYASEISKVLEDVRIVLLVLSKNSAVSENVQNEMDMVYKKKKRNPSLIIIPFSLEENLDEPCFDTIMYYICRYNFLFGKDESDVAAAVDKIIESHADLLGFKKTARKQRVQSLYYTSKREDVRLQKQIELLKRFDSDIYDRCFSGKNSMRILDVGCGDGSLIFDRLSNYTGNVFVVGFDRDEGKINQAQNADSDIQGKFYTIDANDDKLAEKLEKVMQDNGIESFDMVHISMLLLHLKEPIRLLRVLRRVLTKNGLIFIKDIDDGLNFAFPDEQGDFEKVYELCDLSETSGNRNSGRQIYYALHQAGFRDIEIAKQGFSNLGLTYDEKELMFDIYFTFIKGDMEWMQNKYPDDVNIAQKREWYNNNFEDIRDRFLQDDFVFSFGFMIYLAKR